MQSLIAVAENRSVVNRLDPVRAAIGDLQNLGRSQIHLRFVVGMQPRFRHPRSGRTSMRFTWPQCSTCRVGSFLQRLEDAAQLDRRRLRRCRAVPAGCTQVQCFFSCRIQPVQAITISGSGDGAGDPVVDSRFRTLSFTVREFYQFATCVFNSCSRKCRSRALVLELRARRPARGVFADRREQSHAADFLRQLRPPRYLTGRRRKDSADWRPNCRRRSPRRIGALRQPIGAVEADRCRASACPSGDHSASRAATSVRQRRGHRHVAARAACACPRAPTASTSIGSVNASAETCWARRPECRGRTRCRMTAAAASE